MEGWMDLFMERKTVIRVPYRNMKQKFFFLLFKLSLFLQIIFLCQDCLSNDVPPHLAQPCYVALGLALDLRYRNARPNMVNYYLCVPFVCVNIFLPMKTCFFLGIKLLNSYWVQNKKLVIS